MARPTIVALLVALSSTTPVFAQKKVRPDINASKEFSGVYHSPSADTTPKVFHSVYQMEIVVKRGDTDAQVRYANGTVVSTNVIVSVVDAPHTTTEETGGIVSAALLLLDGGGAAADLLAYEPAYGIALFRVRDLELRSLRLSKAPLIANRRVTWNAVFRQGRKTYLYRRPLRISKAELQVEDTTDLCEIMDDGSSSLNADRSGSALVGLDGTLTAIMGRQKHWTVTPKTTTPRKKLAWAVPASVIERLVATANDDG